MSEFNSAFKAACNRQRYYCYLIDRKEGGRPTYEGIKLEKQFDAVDKDLSLKHLIKKRDSLIDEVARLARLINNPERILCEPESNADLEQWSNTLKWSFSEMLALSFNKDPTIVHPYRMAKEKDTEFGKAYFKRAERLKRAKKWRDYDAASLGERVEDEYFGGIQYSEKFLVLAKECIEIAQDVNITFPKQLAHLVMSRPKPSSERDWKIKYEEVAKKYEALKEKIGPLMTKHDTRMKIIYALTAKEPYLFTLGKNNGASSKIEGILQCHDLGADLKTIRDTLKDAHLHCKQD